MTDKQATDSAPGDEQRPDQQHLVADRYPLKHVLEAALLAADEPLTVAQLAALFEEDKQPSATDIARALETLTEDCADRGVELLSVASGFRYQVKQDIHPWVAKLWTERPPRYSRAMLETLALIAYRQPITRGEIESVRGVSLSSNIIRSLQEREWIRIVGHRDVPGKPALFGTTKVFLDYFNLKTLDQLPTLSEIKDMETLEPELQFDEAPEDNPSADETAADGAEDKAQAEPGSDENQVQSDHQPEALETDPPLSAVSEDEERASDAPVAANNENTDPENTGIDQGRDDPADVNEKPNE